jgi:hypothetical protein
MGARGRGDSGEKLPWGFSVPDSLCRQSLIRQDGALKDLIFYTVHRLKPIDTYTFIAARLLRL